MASLSSFTNPNTFTKETRSRQLIAGMLAGSTFFPYNGVNGFTYSGSTATADPGGMFGWLIYSRSKIQSPTKGYTYDTYIEYSDPNSLVNDLNALNGCTSALINTVAGGITYSFFQNNGDNTIKGLTNGNNFLLALNYLAYGGKLVIAGTTAGFTNYQADKQTYIDVVMGITNGTSVPFADICKWVETNPYCVGVFPSINNGAGYTAQGFDGNFSSVAFGDTPVVADRVFNVYGTKTVSLYNTSSLLTNSTITYSQTTVPDICGFFARSKDKGQLYLTVAGKDRSFVLNGNVDNSVSWSNSTLRTILKNNRVNFFINYNPKFLGQDLVGASASSVDATVNERVGPAQMKAAMNRDITQIGLKYLFELNNPATRGLVTSDVSSYLQQYAKFIDTAKTQIVCSSANNTDNSTNLNIFVTVTPLLGLTSFVVNVNLSAS